MVLFVWYDSFLQSAVFASGKFMAHSAVWGAPPIQRQNTNSKKLIIGKLSKSGLRRCTKFGQAHSNDERKITLSFICILYQISEFNFSEVMSWKY